ncbi:shikimate kinase AroK [Teredinibacter turnerae]|uniref:Shikimate kinase n=1 Tax=Teredinibacter turnerae (strain ATCC 39867 / T7901) TaxID=377629 RepID=C5BRJ8_TERTT|nr:shikimate kinase AroK [Teredinibacter turnerae]ACR11823.1 shikimate kinase [Teredinibacter turnerae T7901]
MTRPVFLVGPMGAGKSTIGRMLAQRLEAEFHDTDQVIEARTGADIPWIFDVEGEAGFRDRETSVLDDLAQYQDVVIATGGGIVTREQNRHILQAAGTVIYLTASIDQLVNRTYKDKKRPLLQVDNPREKIVELYTVRDPLYRSVADYVLVTDGRSPKYVVQHIAEYLQR